MTENSQKKAETPQNTGGNGKGMIIIIGLLVVVIGVLGYFLLTKQDENEKLSNEKAETEVKLSEKEAELATRVKELEDLTSQYEAIKAENEALGIKNEELDKKIADLKGQVNGLKSKKQLSDKENSDIKKQIEMFKADLLKKDQEIQALRTQNDSLLADKNNLVTQRHALGDSISNLSKKVSVASVLKAEGIKATVLDDKGKELSAKEEYKAKKVQHFKLKFNLAENSVAKHTKKQICLKVIEPNGSVLFNLDEGSGSFTKNDGTNDMFTAQQALDFNNTNQEVTFLYKKGSEYEKGTYKFEIFADGHPIGKSQLILK